MLTVSGKCMCDRCEARTGDIYRMVGHCSNCGASPVLMIFRAGDGVRTLDCPVCRVLYSVKADRLATDDEYSEALTGEFVKRDGSTGTEYHPTSEHTK